jgi:hypothetical protein
MLMRWRTAIVLVALAALVAVVRPTAAPSALAAAVALVEGWLLFWVDPDDASVKRAMKRRGKT